MCKSKFEGGNGIQEPPSFQSCHARQVSLEDPKQSEFYHLKDIQSQIFPLSDFLNSKLGCNPSYTWRSTHSSIEIIKKGTRWEDRWMPTPSTYKVISPLPHHFDDFPMVFAIIDPDTRRWKADLLRRTFLPFEANTIQNISYSLPKDKII